MSDPITRLGQGGRVVIPVEIRQRLELKEGDELLVIEENGEIRLQPYRARLRRIQAQVRQYVPHGVSLADELIAERRRDAERE